MIQDGRKASDQVQRRVADAIRRPLAKAYAVFLPYTAMLGQRSVAKPLILLARPRGFEPLLPP